MSCCISATAHSHLVATAATNHTITYVYNAPTRNVPRLKHEGHTNVELGGRTKHSECHKRYSFYCRYAAKTNVKNLLVYNTVSTGQPSIFAIQVWHVDQHGSSSCKGTFGPLYFMGLNTMRSEVKKVRDQGQKVNIMLLISLRHQYRPKSTISI